ncbi:41949_t:CDS:2, partial [Gigaspora margarita]
DGNLTITSNTAVSGRIVTLTTTDTTTTAETLATSSVATTSESLYEIVLSALSAMRREQEKARLRIIELETEICDLKDKNQMLENNLHDRRMKRY